MTASPQRRRQGVLLTGAALVFAALLVTTLQTMEPRSTFSIGVTPFRAGNYQDFYSDHFVLLFVTNNARRSIHLDEGVLECSRPNGSVLKNMNVEWRGKEHQVVALPQEAVAVPLAVDTEFVKYRLTFEHSRDAGLLHLLLSKGVRKIPQKFLSANLAAWLRDHGLMDGLLHGKYESPWMANETVQRTGASRSVDENGGKPVAAGSGR